MKIKIFIITLLLVVFAVKVQSNPKDVPPPPPPPIIEEPEMIDFFEIYENPSMYGRGNNILNCLQYPAMAKRAGISGRVMLKFVVSKVGIPTNIRVIWERPKDMGFGSEAVRAFKKVRFKPAMQRDCPVAVRGKYTINFMLNKRIL